MLERPAFVGLPGAGLLSLPAAAATQEKRKVPRVGVLAFTETTPALQDAFRQGLRDLGYVEGQTVVVEWRAAEGRPDRARAFAQEFVRQKVDIIVADLTPAVQAAKSATTTIPIVMASAGDPVRTGFVVSLARPGGNITGLTGISAELSGKRIELLRELLPGLSRVALLVNATNPFVKSLVAETREVVTDAHLHLSVLDVRKPEDLAAAFSELVKRRAGAVIVDAALTPWHAADLALRPRVPSVSNQRRFAESGGLMSHAALPEDI